MFFNSIDFALFLPVVFLLYWFVFNRNLRLQNALIILASYVFYSWWDWRFLSLILFSTLLDYFIGIALTNQNNQVKRRSLLLISILVNLGFLGFFKYYNFFLESFMSAFSYFGTEFKPGTLSIILPVGISFYTFQTLSYSIDVYRRKLTPTKDFVSFAAFVSFFPQLVAGPIERATNLLPQFYKKRKFDYGQAVDGMRQILWGLFKKIVIADNCAEYANMIFDNSEVYSGGSLVMGVTFFAFQIYGDFSGYSDIAIGTSRLFGFNLKQNFVFPYFSRDFGEFWRRWHISLTSWFRDYLYIPLGGSRGSTWRRIRNVFIVFLVSGFWHGANWTFIAWGAINAIYFLPLLLTKSNRKNIEIVAKGKLFPTVREALSILATFSLTLFAWVFFRADDIHHALTYIGKMISGLFDKTGYHQAYSMFSDKIGIAIPILIALFILIEWKGRESNYGLAKFGVKWSRPVRFLFYYLIMMSIFWFGGKEQQFIYFQF